MNKEIILEISPVKTVVVENVLIKRDEKLIKTKIISTTYFPPEGYRKK